MPARPGPAVITQNPVAIARVTLRTRIPRNDTVFIQLRQQKPRFPILTEAAEQDIKGSHKLSDRRHLVDGRRRHESAQKGESGGLPALEFGRLRSAEPTAERGCPDDSDIQNLIAGTESYGWANISLQAPS
jgi:hypothetical protein